MKKAKKGSPYPWTAAGHNGIHPERVKSPPAEPKTAKA